MGICQIFSPSALAAPINLSRKGWLLVNAPMFTCAERDDDGAGQSRGVDQMRAADAPGIGERIDQNQAALGIGIQHFDGLAG